MINTNNLMFRVGVFTFYELIKYYNVYKNSLFNCKTIIYFTFKIGTQTYCVVSLTMAALGFHFTEGSQIITQFTYFWDLQMIVVYSGVFI